MLNYFVGSVRSPVLERYFRHKVHDNKKIWSMKLLLVSSFLIFCSSLRKVKLKIFRRLTLKKFLLLSCWFRIRVGSMLRSNLDKDKKMFGPQHCQKWVTNISFSSNTIQYVQIFQHIHYCIVLVQCQGKKKCLVRDLFLMGLCLIWFLFYPIQQKY